VYKRQFQILDYVMVSESGSKIVYRKKSKLARAMYFWEDQITINTAENPVVLSGMRKAVYRINRSIEQSMIKGQ